MKGTMNHHGIEWARREGIVMPPLPKVHQNLKKAVRKSPIPLHATKQKNKQINKQYIYAARMCVYVYVRMYVCICVYIHAHMGVYVYNYICILIHKFH